MLQEGIFLQEKSKLGKHFGILFIQLSVDSSIMDIDTYLSKLYDMLKPKRWI